MNKLNRDTGRQDSLMSRLAFPILLVIIIGPLVYWSHARNDVWGSTLHLWVDCAKKSPHKARPYNNVGAEFLMMNMVDQSVPWIEKAVQLSSRYPESQDNYQNLLAIYANMGILLAKQGRYVEAISLLRKGLQNAYYDWQPHNNIALYLAALGLYDHAIGELNEAIKINPNVELPRENLARIKEMKAKRGHK